jgi:hypothetical protein
VPGSWLPAVVDRLSFLDECSDPFSAVRVIRTPGQQFSLPFKLVFKRGVKGIGEKVF